MENPLPLHLWDYIYELGHKTDMAPSLEYIRLHGHCIELAEVLDTIDLVCRRRSLGEEIDLLDTHVAELERVLSSPPIDPTVSDLIKQHSNITAELQRMDAYDGWMGLPYTHGWYARRIKRHYGV